MKQWLKASGIQMGHNCTCPQKTPAWNHAGALSKAAKGKKGEGGQAALTAEIICWPVLLQPHRQQ